MTGRPAIPSVCRRRGSPRPEPAAAAGAATPTQLERVKQFMQERKMRSFVLCCALAGALMLTGFGGDGAKKTLEGTWNCANFITVRADTERMLLTPVAFLGIPVDAIDKNMTLLVNQSISISCLILNEKGLKLAIKVFSTP